MSRYHALIIIKVLWWVLSYGAEARPLEPSLLVNKWKQNVEAMKKL